MDPHALELCERGVQFLWDGDAEAAIAELDHAAGHACSEEVAEQIVIRKAEALIAAGRDGAEVAALPEIVLRRRSPRHVYQAAAMLMRHFVDTEPTRALFYGGLARRAADELRDPFAQATVLNGCGVLLVVDSRPVAAMKSLDAALAVIDGARRRDERMAALRAAVVGNLGGAKILADQFTDGVRLLESALPDLPFEDNRCGLYLDLAFGYFGLGNYEAAQVAALRSLELASCPRDVRNANHLLGGISVRLGHDEEAERYFDAVASFYPGFTNVKQILAAIDLCPLVNWNV